LTRIGPLPRRRIQLAERPDGHLLGPAVPGVVHEDVDATDALHRPLHRLEVGDVERRRRCRAAGGADRGGDSLGPLGDHVVHHYLGAPAGEGVGDALADALPGAGDQRHLPVQVEHGVTLTIDFLGRPGSTPS
jgi:hypothetical protein